jgi:hypothetical protein
MVVISISDIRLLKTLQFADLKLETKVNYELIGMFFQVEREIYTEIFADLSIAISQNTHEDEENDNLNFYRKEPQQLLLRLIIKVCIQSETAPSGKINGTGLTGFPWKRTS